MPSRTLSSNSPIQRFPKQFPTSRLNSNLPFKYLAVLPQYTSDVILVKQVRKGRGGPKLTWPMVVAKNIVTLDLPIDQQSMEWRR